MAFRGRAAAPLVINAGVMDDRVHAPDRIDLFRHPVDFGRAAEIPRYDASGFGREVRDRRHAVRRPRVHNYLMASVKERPRRRAPQPVGAPRDKDARHPLSS